MIEIIYIPNFYYLSHMKMPRRFSKPRALFTDGYNSLWHFLFGICGFFYYPTIPLFLLYQLWNPFEKNLFIDIFEFLCGFICAALLWPHFYFIY